MSTWISCKESSPENEAKVLVYGILETENSPDIFEARYFRNINSETGNNAFWEYHWGYDFKEVTHWMPLPEVPK